MSNLRCCVVCPAFKKMQVAQESLAIIGKLMELGIRPSVLPVPISMPDEESARGKIPESVAIRQFSRPSMPIYGTELHGVAYDVWNWLHERESEFDICVFPEHFGLGYYCIMAQAVGLGLDSVRLVTVATGPTLQRLDTKRMLPSRLQEMEQDFLERQSVALSPSLYVLEPAATNWMQRMEWRMPQHIAEDITSALDVAAPGRRSTGAPLVTIGMPHFNRPNLLKRAVQSIEAQDYTNIELIIVDDGSTEPEALGYLAELESRFKPKGWSILRQENKFPGAARNNAARHAKGEYLVFVDDDNIARPELVSTLVRALLLTEADMASCIIDVFEGSAPPPQGKLRHQYIPHGPAAILGLFDNCFGDTTTIFRRDSFMALGGFSEDKGASNEDWELLARATLRGMKLMTVPKPLLWYRYSPGTVNTSTSPYVNSMRSLRPYLDVMSPDLRPVLLLLMGWGMRSIPIADENEQLYAELRKYKKSYEHIMNKPAVRAWRWVKSALGMGGKDAERGPS